MNDKNKKILMHFFEKFELQKIKKNQIVTNENNEIIWVKSGFVRLFKKSKDGKETTLPMLKSAFYFSLSNVLSGTKYQIQAINNIEAYVVSEKAFLEFLDENEEIKIEIYKSMISTLNQTIDAFQKIVDGDAYTKTAILIASMVDTETETKRKNVEIKFAIPHRLLANMTGLTRETITLQLLKMQKEGLVATNVRKLIIKDLDKLEELTNL